ncbi:MAG: hypothetical protein CVU63_04635, partial [Deltaproteobacteria bacterium HGW-Deltaproteobacteria-20]
MRPGPLPLLVRAQPVRGRQPVSRRPLPHTRHHRRIPLVRDLGPPHAHRSAGPVLHDRSRRASQERRREP